MNSASTELSIRYKEFAVSIIRFVQSHKTLPYSVVDQVIRSATSVGANYIEAQNAVSRADFRNKVFIAKKESAETEYWLSIIRELIPDVEMAELIKEAHEITMILQKIVNTLRDNKSAT